MIKTPPILLNAEKILSTLRHSSIDLHILNEIDSTNNYLKTLIGKNEKITICLAETQTQGKGQLDRHWYSPFGENIYLSMLYPVERPMHKLGGLSLVAGLSICHSLKSALDLKNAELNIKWPNDIFINRKKLGGILIEIQRKSPTHYDIIIGIGININMLETPQEVISQDWSSLLKITGQYIDRNIICTLIINTLIDYLDRFLSNTLTDFLEEWQSHDLLAGKAISLISHNKEFQGICAGINKQGELLLKTKNTETLAFSSGHISRYE